MGVGVTGKERRNERGGRERRGGAGKRRTEVEKRWRARIGEEGDK